MPPVGLLALVALGLVFAYALPQRARQRGDYALVRTEDRFSADMRVIRASAARVQGRPAQPGSHAAVPARASSRVGSLGDAVMSRPASPLDRAATRAQHEVVAMRRDRARVLAARRAAARRRAVVGALALAAALGFGAATVASVGPAWSAWAAGGAVTVVGAAVGSGRRAAIAAAAVDAQLVPVAHEVVNAATATSALRRVSSERAAGHRVAPSADETQAIRTLTAEGLAPSAAPAPLPAPELPGADGPGWEPGSVPAPSYTLKPVARAKTPRPIDQGDLFAGLEAAERHADAREAAQPAPAAAPAPLEAEATTATLDDILARRRRRSA